MTRELSAVGIGDAPVPRHPLVTFRVQRDEHGVAFRGADVRLTVEGSELFGDNCQVGEPFDDLNFEMPRR